MIKSIRNNPIAFTGVSEYLECGTKISHRTEAPEDFDNLTYTLSIKNSDVSHTGLSVRDDKLRYKIALKNGDVITLEGNHLLEVSKKRSLKPPSEAPLNEFLKWTLFESDDLCDELIFRFRAVVKHIDNLWVKVP